MLHDRRPAFANGASTRSGLRSPECRADWSSAVGTAMGFNEVRAAKPGVSVPSPASFTMSSCCFNEVRAAKPGVSAIDLRTGRVLLRSASTRSGLRSPECRRCLQRRAADTPGFNEVRAAKPGVSAEEKKGGRGANKASTRSGLRSPECLFHPHPHPHHPAGASTRSGLRSPECPSQAVQSLAQPGRASTRSGLRSPECRLFPLCEASGAP